MDKYADTVFFVYGAVTEEQQPQALGTCFLMERSTGEQSPFDTKEYYVVTAAHVVRRALFSQILMRFKNGQVFRVPVDEWIYHDSADIAATAINILFLQIAQCASIPSTLVEGTSYRAAGLGAQVHFFGLLRNLETMSQEGIPLLRSGTVARLNQRSIRVREGNDVRLVDGHLIDCRAYSGMSGGPCFSQYLDKWPNPNGPGVSIGQRVQLFGLITGHFDEWENAEVPEDFGYEIRSRVNTGVGIVTPAKLISELLDSDELRAMKPPLPPNFGPGNDN